MELSNTLNGGEEGERFLEVKLGVQPFSSFDNSLHRSLILMKLISTPSQKAYGVDFQTVHVRPRGFFHQFEEKDDDVTDSIISFYMHYISCFHHESEMSGLD